MSKDFVDYVKHGWALCPIERGNKKPVGYGWNKRENVITSAERAEYLIGAGLCHAYSGTCAIDVDNVDLARVWLRERGIDIDALFAADDAVMIHRGNPKRGKLIYRLPVPLVTKQIHVDDLMILELRCGATTGNSAQDVLPPTLHPEGEHYQWHYNDPLVTWRDAPLLPEPLHALWLSLLGPTRDSRELPPPTATHAELIRLISHTSPDTNYEEWCKIGMIVHHETGGSDEGLGIWNDWSAAGSKYKGLSDLESHWNSFGHSATPATAGSLRREAVASDADFGAPIDPDLLAQAEAADNAKRALTLIPLRDFARPEPVNYLVEDMIEQGQLIGFIGKRKGGKTYAALALSFAVAQGTEWGGHKVLAPGPVVWIAAEGARSLQQRRSPQWLAHHGDADIRVWPKPLNMRSADTYAALLDVCRDVRLIVIDSLRRVTPGAKENSSDELGEVLAYAERLSLETGATVCIIAHASNKSDAEGDEMTARGSSVIEDQIEAGFFIEKLGEKVDDHDVFRITPGFARDEETGAGAAMHFKLTEIAPEGMVPGVIVDWNAKPAKKKVEQPEVRGGDKLAVNTLNALWPVDSDPVIPIDAFLGKYAESLVHKAGPDNRVTRAMTALDGLTKRGVVDVDNVRKTITLLHDTRVHFGPAPQKEDPDADIL